MKNIPRYVLPAHGDQTFEFAVARENIPTMPIATVSVAANSFPLALVQALEWSKQFTKPEDKAAGRRAFPVVKYGSQQRLVMQVNGVQAYAENRSKGGWLPLAVLSV